MIYVHPVGGLGNMFFHIAAIYALAKDNNDELCLLNVDKKIHDLIHDGRANMDHAPAYKYFFDRFKQTDNYINDKIACPFEYSHIEYRNEREYIGYFQCEKFFKHYRSDILELFKISDTFSAEVNKYSDIFGNISLHVRRNDYVKMYPQIHTPQTMDYYNGALLLLPKDLKVVIFSDDLPWCRENFVGDRYVFIEELDYISLYIMNQMKYHVIANSSFSWWGAWMSNARAVIAPKLWFGGNIYPDQDIVPKNWIKL